MYKRQIQRSGSYVRSYSKDEIEALFDFRAALEAVSYTHLKGGKSQ